MTINEIITLFDDLFINNYEYEKKIKWISELDGKVFENVIEKEESEDHFEPYDKDNYEGKELLIPFPYEDIYITWLKSKVSYHNNDYEQYNNAIVLFNDQFSEYQNWYNRNTNRKKTKIRFF